MRFRAKNGAIREYIASLGANQIARIISDFKMDLIKDGTCTRTGHSQANHFITIFWSEFRGKANDTYWCLSNGVLAMAFSTCTKQRTLGTMMAYLCHSKI